MSNYKPLCYDTGMSMFIPWTDLDKMSTEHLKTLFPENPHIETEVSRDDNSVNLQIFNLHNADKHAWCDLFKRYDKTQDWDALSEFEIEPLGAYLPTDMTMHFLSDVIGHIYHMQFVPHGAIASEYGILFTELAPEGLRGWFPCIETD